MIAAAKIGCPRCSGSGRVALIAGTETGESWARWRDLVGSVAVKSGLVKPINCPHCGGSGKAKP